MPRYECGNCDWKGDELRCGLRDTNDLWDRLDPGGIVPAGECPECWALAYESTDQLRIYDASLIMVGLLKRVRRLIRQANDPKWGSDIVDGLCGMEEEINSVLRSLKAKRRKA